MSSQFVALPQSVLSGIFAQLFHDDYAAFHALRVVCRASRSSSEEFLFREITLAGVNDVETTILQGTRTPGKATGEKIRCIRVRPIRYDPAICEKLVTLLVDCWSYLVQLQRISWETSYPFPPSLQALLVDRPNMRLTYINNDRGPHPMDKAILSSSHLDKLDFTALAYGPEAVCPSEMSKLKQCLLQARNLKTLRLQVGALSWEVMNEDYQESPLNLPFRDGDMFPALEELALDPEHQNYFPTAENSQMWSRCMDWGRLHTLDFGHGTPTALLQALTGRVSQLKTFNFGFWEDYTGAAWACWNSNREMKVLERFLNSIDALRNVKTYCHNDDHMQMVRPTLLAKHGQSLRSLEAKYRRSVAWEPEHFYNLAETARGIKILRLPMKVQTKEGTKGLSVWPDDQATRKTSAVARLKKLFTISSSQKHGVSSLKSSTLSFSPWTPPSAATHQSVHSALASFRHLEQLHLICYLEVDSDQLISYPNSWELGSPQIKEKVAHKLMLRLWHDFGRKSAIQRIEVAFVAAGGSTKIWHYTVSRKWEKRRLDGIWKEKVVVEMWQEGKDYDPSTFDPFG